MGDTRYFDYLNMMSMFLLICVACSIATSNGHPPSWGSDISDDPMVASLRASQNIANNEVDLDADSNVQTIEQSLLPLSRTLCCNRRTQRCCPKKNQIGC